MLDILGTRDISASPDSSNAPNTSSTSQLQLNKAQLAMAEAMALKMQEKDRRREEVL